MASLNSFDDNDEIVTTELCNLGLTDAFDFFELQEPIEQCIGKIGSHVKISKAVIVKLLCFHVLNYRTSCYCSLKVA